MPRFNLKVAAVVIPAALLLTACGGTNSADGASSTPTASSSEIRIDGSSTVAPLAAAAGELFKAENASVNVSVGT